MNFVFACAEISDFLFHDFSGTLTFKMVHYLVDLSLGVVLGFIWFDPTKGSSVHVVFSIISHHVHS